MREMKIAYGSSCFAKVWSNKTITFDALCERLKNTIRTPETAEEYPKLSKVERDRAKDKGGMVGGWLKQGRRKAANVECRSMLTHDIDSADPDFLERYRMLNQYASCLYSTHSHTPEAPRYRIITPLTRDVSPEEYLALTRLLAKEWGIDCVDSCSYRAHQLMYWPTTPSNGEYVFERFDGAWLNPDAFLSAHPGWRDVSLLPTSSRESTLIDRQSKQQADPLAKPGIVGAFCRTYSIEDAIDTFLPDVYQPSAMAGRYDYVPADSSAGVVLYDGKFAYSHHATDPACGQLLSAFDLVRIHRFRDLDDKASADTAPSKLPSYKAMCDFAVQDGAVKGTLANERMEQATAEFENPDEWQKLLELDKQGHVKDTLTNIANIVRYDPGLQNIVFNELTCMLDVIGLLPWRQVKPGWGDADLACAKVYFEQVYRERFFVPDKRNREIVYSYKLREGAEQKIYELIGDICISMKATDYLKMPELTMNRVEVHLSAQERKLYDTLKREMILQLQEGEIDAANAAALSGKLLQMANGAVYDSQGRTVAIHDRKLDALEDLAEAANGKPVLVAYWFKHDLARIQKRFPESRVIDTSRDISEWNAGRISMGLLHPASGGHGLNLQEGGSTVIWYGLTWSLELYQQLNARLWRQGQSAGAVVIHHIVTAGTHDEDVMRALERKDVGQAALIAAVKAQIGEKAHEQKDG